ncbi:MAG: protein kinase [Deltaproteobacteria bacterium]|nr:protein kinase [Deltaproteobacteria bacterium]
MPDDVLRGDVVDGRFQLTSLLGSGHFGTVWRARDLTTNGELALKILRPEICDAPHVLERFEQEARILLEFSHPGIARAIAFSAGPAPPYYIALEYVRGVTLMSELEMRAKARSHYSPAEILALLDPLFDAVAYAHQRGVVHRDLKPANVLIARPSSRPEVKVLDFGIAKVLGMDPGDSTTSGRLLGTPTYLAPEQLNSESIDARTDVFALGTILFELLTLRRAWLRRADGAPMWAHESDPSDAAPNGWLAMLLRICSAPRPRPSQWRAELSEAVDDLVCRSMAVEPGKRYPSVADLWEATRTALSLERTELLAEGEPTAASSDWNERSTEKELGSTEPDLIERRSVPAQLIAPDASFFDQHGSETLVARPPAQSVATSASLGASVTSSATPTRSPMRGVFVPAAISLAAGVLVGFVLHRHFLASIPIAPPKMAPEIDTSIPRRASVPETDGPGVGEIDAAAALGLPALEPTLAPTQTSPSPAHRGGDARRSSRREPAAAKRDSARRKDADATSPVGSTQPVQPDPIRQLYGLLARSSQAPNDSGVIDELSRGIIAASNSLAAGPERTSIQRCAITSALSYDSSALAPCLDRLKKALNSAPR